MLSTIGNVFLKMLGGTRNERLVRARMKVVRDEITAADGRLWGEYLALFGRPGGGADGELAEAARALQVVPLGAKAWLSGKTEKFRKALAEGQPPERILPEAFAAVRYASWIARDHRQFDVQFVAGLVLHENTIAEEATGEGKTIACYPAMYMAVLAGQRVHLVTVNDYLVQRDRDFAAPIFDLLGLRVGAIQQPMDPNGRHGQYACHIVYGTNSEFGFDYLRDNMRSSVAEQVQGGQDYAIIDEVDNILIDEARTPLIISGPAYGDVDRYRKADTVSREIIKRHRTYALAEKRVDAEKRSVKALEGELGKTRGEARASIAKRLEKARAALAGCESALAGCTKYYEVELDKKAAHLTEEGVAAAQDQAAVGSFYVGANMEWPHLLDQALRAHVVYERDKDYVVRDGEVIIVDEFTGRLMEGRQWSDGLHQAVEAKERVPIKEETQTIATITLQNLFKLYKRLAGMTGTAMTEAEEFMKIYRLDVVSVPTHRPVNRVDHEDRIYASVDEKYHALVEEINDYSKAGRPVLVGTTSIEKSERLSEMLTREYGIAHEVLNARPENAGREAEIVALAGHRQPLKRGSRQMVGNVTIATNMAGRGTDIKLGAGVVFADCKVPPDEKMAELGAEVQELFPAGTTKCCIHCPEFDAATGCGHCFKPKVDGEFPMRGRTACAAKVPCGLHIVGTERHEARRIDNQLRGRSGRQGDPGSSRFFLSLRDDLMAIFAGEATLKMLTWLGLGNGEAIEHKGVSKAIARAQKKVEQRNFDIRKNLLDYDEVMDHQRTHFYRRRQEIVEGRGIPRTVADMVAQTIAGAVGDYLAGDYPQRCIAEWARATLDVTVRPDQVPAQAAEDLPIVEGFLRATARDEAAATINRTLGEYADPAEDRRDWDLRGLASWAMSRFRVNVSQNQLRGMDPPEIERLLVEGAAANIETADLSGLATYLETGFARRALVEWVRNKFGVALEVEQVPPDDPAAAEQVISAAVAEAYRRRELEYPCEYAIDVTIAPAGADNIYALKALCDWANRKYDAGLTPEALAGKGIREIRETLVALAEAFLAGGRLEETVDAFLADRGGPPEPSAVIAWADERFDTLLSAADLAGGGVREALVRTGRDFLRRELTELERFVLLQIHDSSWKDHLLAMDHLKEGVYFQAHAQQDPKIVYKKEGYNLFQEMLAGVREKVTDIVFKARLGRGAEMASVYQISRMVHEQLVGYDHLAQDMAAQQEAAQPTKIEQIVRDMPKVGRNDPCPCGSGKKYKKCCGRSA